MLCYALNILKLDIATAYRALSPLAIYWSLAFLDKRLAASEAHCFVWGAILSSASASRFGCLTEGSGGASAHPALEGFNVFVIVGDYSLIKHLLLKLHFNPVL